MAWLALPRRGVCIKALVAELRVTDANLFVVGLEVGVILAGCALLFDKEGTRKRGEGETGRELSINH